MNDSKRMKKFEHVPVEDGTLIIHRTADTFGKYDALYEMWAWDGITAQSIIFASEDVADLEDSEIKDKVKASPLFNKGSSMTFARHEPGFTFVNFNFHSDIDDEVLPFYKDERTEEEKQQDRKKANQYVGDKNNATIARIRKRKSLKDDEHEQRKDDY